MLELKNISWSAPDGRKVLDSVSLTIPESGLTVITGPNGGGKTTLAKILAGIEKPQEGRIIFSGEDITDLDVTERARKGISYAFQQPVRFKGITVRDLLEIAHGSRIDEQTLCSLLSKVGLCARDYEDREVNASLSGGEIKRIEIATVLARDSKLSVFDEPEAGIDLWSFQGLIDAFQEIRKAPDRSEIIISHQERILSVADRIAVIENGHLAEEGARDEILPHLISASRCPACPTPTLRRSDV